MAPAISCKLQSSARVEPVSDMSFPVSAEHPHPCWTHGSWTRAPGMEQRQVPPRWEQLPLP